MINYNLKPAYNYTLIAKEINLHQTNKPVKNYQFDLQKDTITCFLDPQDFDLTVFYKHLRNWVLKSHVDINVDLESFFKIVKLDLHEQLYTCVLSVLNLSQKNLYNLKSTTKKPDLNFNVLIDPTRLAKFSQTLGIIEGENFARKLQLMPANILTAAHFIDEVKQFFQPLKDLIEISVIDQKMMIHKKMNLILSVNAASVNQPYLLCIKYLPNKNAPIKSYIGKGILFDTGGINLKPSNSMDGMQYDMSGAAIVAGTVYAIAKNKLKTNVVALMPLSENAIGGGSTHPSDVITSYNGLSVEINNTDAEGRLVLADAITYAIKDLHANEIVTVATLTGAAEVALGDSYTAVFATDETNWNQIQTAAIKAGEAIWRMPFNFEFEQRVYASKIADVVNSDKLRSAGVSMGAEFLKAFCENKNLVHLDIASSSEYQHQPVPIMLRTLYEMSKNEH